MHLLYDDDDDNDDDDDHYDDDDDGKSKVSFSSLTMTLHYDHQQGLPMPNLSSGPPRSEDLHMALSFYQVVTLH